MSHQYTVRSATAILIGGTIGSGLGVLFSSPLGGAVIGVGTALAVTIMWIYPVIRLKPTPEGWGEDALTEYFDTTRNNLFASYANLQPLFSHLASIENIFRDLIDKLDAKEQWLPAFFLMRVHS